MTSANSVLYSIHIGCRAVCAEELTLIHIHPIPVRYRKTLHMNTTQPNGIHIRCKQEGRKVNSINIIIDR